MIQCPGNIVTNTNSLMNFATVTWNQPNVTDNSGEMLTPTLSETSGSQFGIGPTTVLVNATDSNNNMANCSFTIEVQGNKQTCIPVLKL